MAATVSKKLSPRSQKRFDFLMANVPMGLGKVFRLMGVAEEEILAAKKGALPRRAARLDRAFAILMPGDLLGYGEDVYRAHVRELLRRVAKHEDVRSGTDAEVLAALSRGSLQAPLDSTHTAAMEKCFFSVFGRYVNGDLARESYEGAADEVIARLRRVIGDRTKRVFE